MPHAKDWERGGVSLADMRSREPLIVQRLAQEPERKERRMLSVDNPSVEVAALWTEGEECFVRLFSAGSGESALGLGGELAEWNLVCTDLNGAVTGNETDRIRGFEIKTLRCTGRQENVP